MDRRGSESAPPAEASAHVTDEMIDAIAVQAPIDSIGLTIRDAYGDVADGVYLSLEFGDEPYWEDLVDSL